MRPGSAAGDLAPSDLESVEARLERFVLGSRFCSAGGIVTDLDGTAVHEHEGRIAIPKVVEHALMRLVELGRPLVLNTLRFPLSVLRTFGREWYRISERPLPLVALNGSQLGRIVQTSDGELGFEELAASLLSPDDVQRALSPVEVLLKDGIRDVLVFYYPRDWRVGEVIWTPSPEKVLAVKDKYRSASAVTAIAFDKLRSELTSSEICMIFLIIDVPADHRMAYQHTQGSHFFTASGVNKLSGALAMARSVGFELAESIGAGDSEMDTFLTGVGCAILVGSPRLALRGLRETLGVPDSLALGELLFDLVELHGGPSG